ncbi:MAG TPA: heparan-alpha-glucosaminide N-acetyltransferase domain-containing protein [Methylomirabilota bacterium]|nr:heparan-alpha-glucosaminide N-acetyltransferase domain-containing protein [Methylomirabilota bacterium]
MGARLLSLDAFRGLAIAGMVLVNNPGTWAAVYAPLRHARWHGLTPTDLVFPFFLFIVGVAIPASLHGREPAAVLPRIVRRTLVIFALGLVLNAVPFFDVATLRIPGVLQRIAICYLVAALLFLTTSARTEALVAVALLVGYWAALVLVPVPGYGRADLGPEGNVAAWLDRTLLGAHVWRGSRVYDPEGILSTVPSVATVLFGVLSGRWLRADRPERVIAGGLTVAGVVAAAVGLAWARWLPLNKALWTSSYAVLTAGIAILVFAAIYWVVEIRGWRRGARPLAVLGVNALALYVLSSLLAQCLALIPLAGGITAKRYLFEHLFATWASPVNASLAYAASYLLLWWLAMWLLDRSGVRLRA